MSDTDVLPEGGGAQLPPKRPTIIRPAQDGQGSLPPRPIPARPAPPRPGSRAPPAVPKPPAAAEASGPVPATVPKRPSGPAPSSAPTQKPDVHANSKPKSQGSVRKRPEITIVDARPMSQAGFRDIPSSGSSANTKITKVDASSTKPSSTGNVSAASNCSPSAPSCHSTPPPSHSPPPVPQSRPGALHPSPAAQFEYPTPASNQPETNSSAPPVKPSRPTILRPARPKSAIVSNEPSSEEPKSPPPPLPKRSPIVSETASNLIDLDPPPKPARSVHLSEQQPPEEEKKTEKEEEKSPGPVAPKKPTRVSIIRPQPRPKSSVDQPDGTAERSEPQDGSSQLPRPKPPPPVNKPVAVVTATPKDSTSADSEQPDSIQPTRTSVPPVPAARPRGSPRNPTREGSADHESPEASPRNLRKNASEEIDRQSSQVSVDKIQGIPDRPRPPVPVSRPHATPAAGSGGSPKPSHSPVLSKPPPPGAVPPVPSVPPSVPSKPPTSLAAVQDAEGSLYAVSNPLEDTDSFSKSPASSGNQPSRPPPPVPKSRPQPNLPPSPMVGRPLPSVPPESSGNSPSSDQGHLYEDVEAVKNQAVSLAKTHPDDVSQMDPSDRSSRNTVEDTGTSSAKTEDDISALYAKVNKPSKRNISQSSVPSSSQSEDVPSNPFGIKLKSTVSENSSVSESQSSHNPVSGELTDAKKPPVLSPKPKPNVLPKPQPAAKPRSPNKEDAPAETATVPQDTSTKPEPQEQNKPPVAKRPTIIRPPKPAPRSDNTDTSKKDEDNLDVHMRNNSDGSFPRPQPEYSGNEESKTSLPAPPVPSKRPVTIIGLPQHTKKTPEPAVDERQSSASSVQRDQEACVESSPGEIKSDIDSPVVLEETQACPPQPQRPAAPPQMSRPPPARPGSKPPRPQNQPSSASEPVEIRKSDSESPSHKPPSPTLAQTTNRPTPLKEDAVLRGEEEASVSSLSRCTPPVERKESSPPKEEEVKKRPSRPGAPPPRPMSMPPVKAPLSAVTPAPKSVSHTTDVKNEKPLRPQPMRPPAPKETESTASPPPLPHRPGLSHPLYGYMAGVPHAIALHDYPASQPDELPFQEGDAVVLLARVDDQWLKGQVGDKEGIFPENFVTVIHPLHDELPPSAIDEVIDQVFGEALQEKPDLLKGPRCRARFDFEGEGQGDLPFEDGDVIQLLSRCGDDWLKGELDRKVGVFPVAFVEIIEDLPEETGSHGAVTGGGNEVTALFDFQGEPGELSFEAGDRILILSRVNDQWLFGKSGGSQGSFPSSFVDTIPGDLPQYIPDTASQSLDSVDSAQSSQPAASADSSMKNKPQQWCTALYSFEKGQEGDLEFREGDHIEVVEQVGQDWLRGRLHGQEGVFPASFVQLDSGSVSGTTVQEHEEDHSTGLTLHSDLVKGKAQFDFTGEADCELTFKAGDEIVLGSMVSEGSDWQWGELNGKKGMFPASFVEMI